MASLRYRSVHQNRGGNIITNCSTRVLLLFVVFVYFTIAKHTFNLVLGWNCVSTQSGKNLVRIHVHKSILIEGDQLTIDCTLNETTVREITSHQPLNFTNLHLRHTHVGSSLLPGDNVDGISSRAEEQMDNGFIRNISNDRLSVRFMRNNVTPDDSGIYECLVIGNSDELSLLDDENDSTCKEEVYVLHNSINCRFAVSETLECSWNKLPGLRYNLQYRDGDRNYPCPSDNDDQCIWQRDSMPTVPEWRQCHNSNHSVTLIMDVIPIDHLRLHLLERQNNVTITFNLLCSEVLELPKLLDFNHANVTSTSAVVMWKSDETTQWLQDLYNLKILFIYKAETKQFTISSLSTTSRLLGAPIEKILNGGEHQLTLTNLMPNTDYTISARVISMNNVNSEILNRGQEFVQTFKTNCSRPGKAPIIEHCSFEIDETIEGHTKKEDITVYWQNLDPAYYNGDDFGYRVIEKIEGTATNRIYRETICQETRATCARLTADRSNIDISHNFTIVPFNKCQSGPYSASIVVPPRENLLPKPYLLSATMLSRGSYNISWVDVDRKNEVEFNSTLGYYYTLLWCSDFHSSTNNCLSIEGAKNVSSSLRWHLIELPEESSFSVVRKFAIAYNEEKRRKTSGLLWSDCTVHASSDKGFRAFFTIVNATTLKISWSFECSSQQSSITQYNFELSSKRIPTVSACNNNQSSDYYSLFGEIEHVVRTFDSTWPNALQRYTLFTVSPFAQYNITMSVESDRITTTTPDKQNKTMQLSMPEYYPKDPPRNLSTINNTHSSIHLAWLPPLMENGPSYHYRIVYSKSTDDSREQWMNVLSNQTICSQINNLTNLESYANYTISVRACINSTNTTDDRSNDQLCSPSSNNIFVRTRSSKPPKVSCLLCCYLVIF